MVRPPVSNDICVLCKGARLLCGKTSCPILLKKSVLKTTLTIEPKKLPTNATLFGASPPAVFVGHYGYPIVNIGPLIPLGEFAEKNDTQILDSPEAWFGKPMQEIMSYRSGLVRSNFKIAVRYNDTVETIEERIKRNEVKLLETTQELTMGARSVDTEANLHKIRVTMDYDNHSQPQGPFGQTESLKITENVKVAIPVEKAVGDRDLKSVEAITDVLYPSNEISETQIQRILSAGLLGEYKNRRIVPTRWAITAVDDIIGKKLAYPIHHFPEIDKYYTFYGEYLDNKFVIVLVPGPWSYEMNEVWQMGSVWNQFNSEPNVINDFEMEKGRTTYADHITGAYYAARKEIEEFLIKNRRQARALIFREVSGGYVVPLGVWVIRETIRNALAEGFTGPNVKTHETLNSALSRITQHLTVPMKYWLAASHLIPYMRTQRTLDKWVRLPT